MRDCGAQGEWDGYKLIYRWQLDDLEALPKTRPAAELAPGWHRGFSGDRDSVARKNSDYPRRGGEIARPPKLKP